jgi:hypothetical protein
MYRAWRNLVEARRVNVQVNRAKERARARARGLLVQAGFDPDADAGGAASEPDPGTVAPDDPDREWILLADARAHMLRYRSARRVQWAWRTFTIRRAAWHQSVRRKCAIRIQALARGWLARDRLDEDFDYDDAVFLRAVAKRLGASRGVIRKYVPTNLRYCLIQSFVNETQATLRE